MIIQRRIFITSKDVAILYDRTHRYGRKLLRALQKRLKKEPWQPVTFDEFCRYMGLDIEQVYRKLDM